MNRFTYGLAAAVVATMLLTASVLASPMAISNFLMGLPTVFNTAIAQPGSGITHTISMTAETLPNGQQAYMMVSHNIDGEESETDYADIATIPGPTIVVRAGDEVKVTLTNNVAGKSVGFNVPGLSNSNAKASSGGSKTYTFTAGSPGTYLYQNKDDALLGLFGALVVNPASGPVGKYVAEGTGTPTEVELDNLQREYVLFMVGSTFWGQEIDDGAQTPLWTNPTLGADLNELVRFHILSVGPGHTFHLHAHRWVESTTNDNIIDTRLMKDGFDTHTFIVESGADVGEGHWQYHCHVFAHMEAGMHGMFKVGTDNEPGMSIAGANPYSGHPITGATDDSEPGLVTFIISDEPGSWFRSARADALAPVTVSKSLEIAREGDYVNFIMSDTATVHTITSLLWPTGAEHMPMDEVTSYNGGGIVQMTEAGLYVFTCKVHPYMFGAVIADDLSTPAVELGETIDLVQYPGLHFPTASDIATRLLRTFFIATVPENWQDYSSADPWHVSYPDVAPAILFKVGTGSGTADVPLKETLEALYGQDIVLNALEDPVTPGVGEVWIDTQFEKTAGKVKPGTATAVDTTTWAVTKKVGLPQINMNNPHNMWTDKDQTVIYQTEWFSNKLTTFDRETGALISQIDVGESPSHVMTRANNDDIHVALNGEEGVAEIFATTSPSKVNRIIATQGYGQDPTHPHAHWMSHDGEKMVTPNSFTGDSTLFGFDSNSIEAKPATGALPIATGMMPDASKYYVANLLHSTISVIDMDTGLKIKDINGLEDYNPLAIAPTSGVGDGNWPLDSEGPDGILQLGALPIQTPVSPNGQYMVTANTLSATITVVDTETDEIVVTMFCDAGCHGVNFGAKDGGGYYAYVSSKFSNAMIVVDGDPNGDGNPSDAAIVGRILLTSEDGMTTDTPAPVEVTGNAGTGGQGVMAIPNVYNGWVQNLPDEWKALLTEEQQNPVP